MILYFFTFSFLAPVQFALNFLFVVGCFAYREHTRGLRIPLAYGVLALIQSTFGIYATVLAPPGSGYEAILSRGIPVFVLSEFLLFMLYIASCLSNKNAEIGVRAAALILTALVAGPWMLEKSISALPANLAAISAYAVIVSCLYYYLELLYSPPDGHLSENPRFWNITGIFLLCVLLIPFSPGGTSALCAPHAYPAYPVIFLGYMALFISFVKALACQIQITNH